MAKRGNFLTILKREISAYFNSPIAYIFTIVFVVLSASMYMTYFFLAGRADMRNFFSLLPIILSVFLPAMTMRLWAEERKGNTLELLLTFPMRTSQLVLGKYFASLLFYLFSLAGTLLIPVMLVLIGEPDLGPIVGGYIGAVLIGAFYLALGIFISGICRDQIVAFILSMMACFFFYLSGLDFMAQTIDGWISGVGTFLKDNLGMTKHFSGFEKGVVDVRDIIYFFVMTTIFLVLNVLGLEDRMRPKAKLLFGGAVVVGLGSAILVNTLILDVSLGRFDLTENKIYTVSSSTKSILEKLKAPVTVKFYVSPRAKMPTAFKTLEQDVVDKLDELKVVSKGKLQFKTYYLESANVQRPASQGEQTETASFEIQLLEKGINPFQVQSIEEDEIGIKLIYSALSIAYKEKPEQIIARVVPQTLDNFEYELVSRIYRMTLERVPKVVLIAPFEEQQLDPQMKALLAQLGQAVPAGQYIKDDFNVLEAALRYEEYDYARVRLTKDDPIPAGTDTLVIVSPIDFNERQRYEISRFLASGGNVFLAAQRYVYEYNPSGGRGVSIVPREIEIGVNELLEEYGLGLSDQLLFDENAEVINISGAARLGPFAVSIPVQVPVQISILEEFVNKDVSIMNVVSSLFYLWGSSIDLKDEKIKDLNLSATTLFTSSYASWKVNFLNRPLTPGDLDMNTGAEQGPFVLSCMVEGQFPDVYQDQDVPLWPQDEKPDLTDDESFESITEEKNPIELNPGKLIVVGCSKMFEENFIKSKDMLAFFMNSIDAITLGGELINIRGHKTQERRIKKVDKAQKLWYRFLTILLVPVVVAVCGLLRVLRRRKEKKIYLSNLAEFSGSPT
ncbi:Gldg family protein [PVC group bacterium]|nr:Gldg family protein [PVC group bacterium]